MPNTKSAKKALRQSKRKRSHNMFWKNRISGVIRDIRKKLESKDVDLDIIKQDESKLYKYVDKAAKNNVIHKNKAKRIKSKVSKKIAAHEQSGSKKSKSSKSGSSKSKAKSKSSE